jgi:hypothetical protein
MYEHAIEHARIMATRFSMMRPFRDLEYTISVASAAAAQNAQLLQGKQSYKWRVVVLLAEHESQFSNSCVNFYTGCREWFWGCATT